VIADLADREDVRRCAQELAQNHPRIDVLVHNAGALFNERKRVEDGTDMTVELMVSTPFLLTCENSAYSIAFILAGSVHLALQTHCLVSRNF